jgi:hypothetical protein
MTSLLRRLARWSGAALLTGLCLSPGRASADVDLWPLFEKTDDSLTVLYPFWVQEKSFHMVLPFYYRTNEGRDQHVLWPLFKFSEDRGLVRAAPVYYGGEEAGEFTLFPLYQHTAEHTITLIPPRYTTADDQVEIIFPVYAYTSETNAANERTESLNLFWPLYERSVARAANGQTTEQSRRFLLFSDERDAQGRRTFSVLGIPVSEQL